MSHAFQLRSGQRRFHQVVDAYRISAFLARRQYGKTTSVASVALKKMMRTRGHTVVFGSAKLSLSREIVRKESQIMREALLGLRLANAAARLKFTDDGKAIPVNISADDFAEIFEAQRLEFRFYHSNSASDYSRTKVVALVPDAVGETGDLMLDEVGRVRNFREVWEAVKPIISSNPNFRCCLTTTPPPDDTHFSFDLLAPPLGMEFEPNLHGHEYDTEHHVHVLRLDAFDAALDGVPLYDDATGALMTPAEHRAADWDKDAWDRNYGVKFILGGTSACGLQQLDTAQRRGIGSTMCFQVDSDLAFDHALTWLGRMVSPTNPVTLGVDWATTEKAVSNPTAVAVVEREGANLIVRAVLVWKTADPDLAEDRLARIVRTIHAREGGLRVRRLAQDATSEKYFCERIKKSLRGLCPVENVVGSESVDRPGGERINMKQLRSSMYVAALEDNQLTLPPERYLREDHRLPKREKGTFICEANGAGMHGDTFDAASLGVYAHTRTGGLGTPRPCAVGKPEEAMA